jgi:hypothetical protein
MSNSKNYNSIVFLTTLSVYLGLVLVGATPSVLAQNSTDDPNKVNILVPGKGYIFTFDLNPAIKLNKLAQRQSALVEMSGRLILSQQKSTNWQIINSSGNKTILDFIQKEFFAPASATIIPDTSLFPIPKELFQSIKVSDENIVISRRSNYDSIEKAVDFANVYGRVIDYARSPQAEKKLSDNLLIINTEVHSENNQVFIVTNLPRASIDELLADKSDAR